MSSPILFLIIWAVFNILIKSSRDKKKAQNAKRKPEDRTSVSNNSNMTQRNRKPQKKSFRQTIEEYKAQIEKEFAMETSANQKATEKEPVFKKQLTLEETRQEFKDNQYKREEEVAKEPVTIIEETEIGSEVFFHIKEDILKGVIYSEILDKPKSLQ